MPWWCHVALALVDCVLTLSFTHLVVPGAGWMFSMPAGLLWKAGRAWEWVSGNRTLLTSAGCAPGGPGKQGISGEGSKLDVLPPPLDLGVGSRTAGKAMSQTIVSWLP